MALIIHVNVNGISTVCVFQEFDQSLELDTFLVYYFLVPKLGTVPIKMWNAVFNLSPKSFILSFSSVNTFNSSRYGNVFQI